MSLASSDSPQPSGSDSTTPAGSDARAPDPLASRGGVDPALTKGPAGSSSSSSASESSGTPSAPDLFELLYSELHAIARAWFRNQPLNHTLQPTALVHEAYLRMAEVSPDRVRDRTHFLATAARAMRQILVDHARRRNALKRGGGRARVPLDQIRVAAAESELDLEALHDTLEELQHLNPRQAQIVELRFFGGLTVAETAEVVGIAPRTVKLDWQFARAWLLHECERRGQSDGRRPAESDADAKPHARPPGEGRTDHRSGDGEDDDADG